MEKIAIFVDVQNIYYTTRQAYQGQFNYRRFWESINADGSDSDSNCLCQLKAVTAANINFKLH